MIDWDAEIHEAETNGQANECCLKYIDLAKQILADKEQGDLRCEELHLPKLEEAKTILWDALMDIGGFETNHPCKCQCANQCIDLAQEACRKWETKKSI